MRKKIYLFIVFQCLMLTVSFGQTNTFEYSDTAIYKVETTDDDAYETKNYETAIQIPDTSLVKHAVINLKDSIQLWKKDKNLAYLQNLDSLLAKEQAKEDAALDNTLDKAEKGFTFFDRLFGSAFFQSFLWLIAALALIFILYKLFLSKGLFTKSDKETNNVQELPEEELLQLGNYEKLIQEAIQQSDYRLATRYLFLHSLKLMGDKEIISYAADKTNRDYLFQLPENLKPGFRNIARHYDYIWYGRQSIEQEKFENIQLIFKQYNLAF